MNRSSLNELPAILENRNRGIPPFTPRPKTMNPVLSLILSLLVTQIKPADIAAVLAELANFLDPLIAKRGLVLRAVWFFVRSRLSSPSAVTDVQALLADIAGTPEVTAAIRANKSFPFPN